MHRSSVSACALLLITLAACEQPRPTGPLASAGADPASLEFPTAPLGRPLPNLSATELQLFNRGSAVFATAFTPATGLGPLFNSNSCASCHGRPVSGGSGDSVEVHQTAFTNDICDDLEDIGGQVIQQHSTPALRRALGISREPFLVEATGTGFRTTPSLLGFGLVEAVPDSEILAIAAREAGAGDGVHGRASILVDGRVARFGRKDVAATIADFNADAFVYEMGITDSAEPDEQTIHGNPLPAGVDPTPDPEISSRDFAATAAFIRFLAPPPSSQGSSSRAGSRLFTQVRCAECHVPELRTGPNVSRALANKVVYAYSDLLLHDMGPGLSDICLGNATPGEFRTEPLMGIRFKKRFLHDGRARTLMDAVRAHGGEATKSRNAFLTLSLADRLALLEFVGGL